MDRGGAPLLGGGADGRLTGVVGACCCCCADGGGGSMTELLPCSVTLILRMGMSASTSSCESLCTEVRWRFTFLRQE